MAFNIANFGPVGNQSRRGKAPQIWAYATLDAATTIDGSGYFNSAVAYSGAYNLLELGDIIFAVIWATAVYGAGTVTDAGVFIVNGKASGTVDVTNAVDLLVTDAD